MKNIIFDTNAYRWLAVGKEEVLNLVLASDVVFFSTVMLGELYYGFHGGTKNEWNINRLQTFLDMNEVKVLDITHETSKIYGKIKNELKQTGKMIPQNDIWIAAHAIETNSILITYDNHFKNIQDLKLWNSNSCPQ